MKRVASYRPLTILLVVLFLISPAFAHAAISAVLTPIIPTSGQCVCVGGAPNWACVLATLQIVFNDLVTLSSIIITIFIVWAAFAYIMTPISAEGRQKANHRLVNAVLGLVIILCAWLFVDSLMKVIYNSAAGGDGVAQLGPWNSLLSTGSTSYCFVALPTPPPLPGTISGTNNPAGGVATPTVTPAATAPTGTCGSTSHLNCAAAVAWLTANVTNTNDLGICLTDIQKAFNAGGLSLSCPGPTGKGWAGSCNGPLQALNFTSLGSSDSSPQAGDVVVIQHTTGNMIGHIAMFTGSVWISDFVQSSSESPPGNPYSSGFGGATYWRP